MCAHARVREKETRGGGRGAEALTDTKVIAMNPDEERITCAPENTQRASAKKSKHNLPFLSLTHQHSPN